VIANGDVEAIPFPLCGGFDDAFFLAMSDAVADGVLDDGLKEEAWNEAMKSAGIDLNVDAKTIGEADLLDGEVVVDDFELLGEPDFLGGSALEGGSENGVEVIEHFGRFALLAEFDERGNGVKGVEEEVRLELHLEGFELGGGELALELEGADGFALGADLGLDGSDETKDESVDEDVEADAIELKHAGEGGKRGDGLAPLGDDNAEAAEENEVDGGESEGESELHCHAGEGEAHEGGLARSGFPEGGRNQSPPAPEDDAVEQRWEVRDGLAFLRGAEGEDERCAGDDEMASALEVFAWIARCGLGVRLNGGVGDRVERAHGITSLRTDSAPAERGEGKRNHP